MFKKGDRIRVKNFTPKFNGELGTVNKIDGFYVWVFLDCQPANKDYPLELLINEVQDV